MKRVYMDGIHTHRPFWDVSNRARAGDAADAAPVAPESVRYPIECW